MHTYIYFISKFCLSVVVRSNVNMVMCLTVFYLTAFAVECVFSLTTFAVDCVVFRTVIYLVVV